MAPQLLSALRESLSAIPAPASSPPPHLHLLSFGATPAALASSSSPPSVQPPSPFLVAVPFPYPFASSRQHPCPYSIPRSRRDKVERPPRGSHAPTRPSRYIPASPVEDAANHPHPCASRAALLPKMEEETQN